MKQRVVYHILLPLVPAYFAAMAQENSLQTQIKQILEQAKGHVGVAVLALESGDSLTLNGNDHFPMQSVYKFPLALVVLSRVDNGELSLDQRIHLRKEDLLPNT